MTSAATRAAMRSIARVRRDRLDIRPARLDEAAAVRELDTLAFPADSPDQQRAAPGELEDGVTAGDVHVLVRGREPIAYIHVDRARPERVYVSGIAVRPDFQGLGLGSMLIDHFLRSTPGEVRARTPIVTITSPRNLVMLRVILRRGFAGRWFLRDYFGPGRDRLCCQLRSGPAAPSASIYRVPVTATGVLRSLMDAQRLALTALANSDNGPLFELVPVCPGEFVPGGRP